ncbi:phospholipase D-like domain-containing protein [Pelagicoccus sp. SDUM812005]|uniref:phospholipase D-like domain-containing protein n=1 Tax=Pelagicoccus sp. SDUM812005 TaxID=3041257 RepID=UPI00280F65DD|nr:phospholipase D-like domain-containing protein [Pelagicoccus sp. SDUM812005]MDQ8181113.1 phospholipase D-like domain-containing protein [Pelagicoccus sp. SDUM812005]
MPPPQIQEDNATTLSDQSDPRSYDDQLRFLEHMIGVPFTTGNKIEALLNGDQIFPAMLEAIRDAKESILFETYVYWTGDIADQFSRLLARKAQEGVTVRVLLDAHGAAKTNKSYVKRMQDAGAQVKWFRPLRFRIWDYDKRTHRKVLVTDNTVGFTGGVGIAEEWEGDANDSSEWRETHFRIVGPAVAGLCGAFWNNWIDIEGERLPEFESFPPPLDSPGKSKILVARSAPATHQSEMELVFEALILGAKKRLTLTTPYFNIRPSTLKLLKLKAEQGVSIQILLPGQKIDKRFENLVADECIEGLINIPNIEIYRYQRSMIHAKVIRVDKAVSCVGSPNFNQRSRKKDFEVAMIVHDRELAATLDQHFAQDLALSEPIDPRSIKRPNVVKLIARKFLMLFKEQL